MAGLRLFLGDQVRASLRRLLGATSSAERFKVALLLLGALIMAPGLWDRTAHGATLLSLGESHVFIHLMTWTFWLWPLVPLLDGRQAERPLAALLRHPLSRTHLLVLTVLARLTGPFCWLALICHLMLWRVVGSAPFPLPTAVALILLLLMGMGAMVLVSLLADWLRNRGTATIIALLLLGLTLTPAVQEVEQLLPYFPGLVAEAALGKGVSAYLLLAAPLVWAAAVLLFFQVLNDVRDHLGSGPARGNWLPHLPWPTGRRAALIRLLFPGLLRFMEPWLTWLFAVGLIRYLLLTPQPEPAAFWFALFLTTVVPGSLAGNLFGGDGQGFVRLSLLPLSTRDILWCKNAALALLLSCHLIPMIAAALFAYGWIIALTALFTACNLFLLISAQGNRASVIHAAPRDFTIAAPSQGGGFLGLVFLAGLLMGGTALTINLNRIDPRMSLLVQLVLVGPCLLLAGHRLNQAARLLEQQWEKVTVALLDGRYQA